MTRLLVITVVLVLFAGALCQNVKRPALPQYMAIDLGKVVCNGGTGVPCAGSIEGVMHGWYQFDDDGNFLYYREDAVLGNETIVYNREYYGPNGSYEYMLVSSSSSSLMCFHFAVPVTFSRYFLQNATYIGITVANNERVHAFAANFFVMGQPVNITAWTLVNDPSKVYGWENGPVSYYFLSVTDAPPFSHSLFQRPTDVDCKTVPFP